MNKLFLLKAFTVMASVTAEEVRVSLGESIQAVLDAAAPGDSIIVEAGTYQEDAGSATYGLHVTTDNLTLMGEGGNVRLLAVGNQQTGLYAAPPGCEFTESACEAPELQNFVVQGFSVENFPRNGIQVGVSEKQSRFTLYFVSLTFSSPAVWYR